MTFQRPFKLALVLPLLLAGMAAFVAALYHVSSPHLLMPEAGGRWVVSANPPDLAAQRPEFALAQFRTVVTLTAPPSSAVAQLHSLGQAALFVNGRNVALSAPRHGRLESANVDVAPYLRAGANEIAVVVRHSWGPAAILLSCPALDLPASIEWRVSQDGNFWTKAAAATDRAEATGARPSSMSRWNGPEQLAAHAPLLLLLAAAGAAAVCALRRAAPAPGRARQLLRAWQWLLLLGVALLHAWNFTRLPDTQGMDMLRHVEYVDYILERHALPFAEEGWQLFQPPLTYLIAAAGESLRAFAAPAVAPLDLLRAQTLAYSLVAAWAACRACALAFDRAGTAAAAMVLAAFLPVNLYMAPAFSNEPLAGMFGALLVLEAVRLWQSARLAPSNVARIGIWLGLGLLSKPSLVLLLPPLLVLLGWRAYRSAGWAGAVRAVGAVLALALALGGWWYGRNILHSGRPFVGGWEPGRGIDWWQYPGFRVPEHWLRFGEALVRPIYAGLDSFWDSIYSTLWLDGALSGQLYMDHAPPWDYRFMVTLALLALPLTAAIGWGAVRALWRPASAGERGLAGFACASLALLLMAMAGMYGKVPAFSPGKGSYLLCAQVCLPLLAGMGIDQLMRRTYGRVAVGAYAAIWLGFVALAFMAR
jgi:hypothetical protein